MTSYEDGEIRKADALASWSFIGIPFPIIGWILAGMSSSRLKYLPDNGITKRIRRKIVTSVTMSILVCVVSGVLVGLALQQARQQAIEVEKQLQAEQDAAILVQTRKQDALNTCLDVVNAWADESYKSVETVFQEQNLLQSKQQGIEECQVRFPVDQ